MDRRDSLIDVGLWGAVLGVLSFRLPVTAVILLLHSGSYIVLRLWEANWIPNFINWAHVADQSRLSLQAMSEGRYYTLLTCHLFNTDIIHLAYGCISAGFMYAQVEKRVGPKLTATLVLLAIAIPSACFLWVSHLKAGYDTGSPIARWAVDTFHLQHQTYWNVWQMAPLWIAPSMAWLLTTRRGELFWAVLAIGAAALAEFTWVPHYVGLNRAWETYLAAAVVGLSLGLVARLMLRRDGTL